MREDYFKCRGTINWAKRHAFSCLLLLSLSGLHIYLGFGNLRQLLVGLAFFFKSLLKKRGGFLVTQLISKRPSAPIAGNFVMLHALGGCNQGRVQDHGFGAITDYFIPLFQQSLHSLAFLS